MRARALVQGWRGLGVAALGLVLLAAGCETPPRSTSPRSRNEIDPTRVPTRDDITAVYNFYSKPPWLRDNNGRVVGIKATGYFHSAKTELGAFVPGTILVWLYSVERAPEGGVRREFVHGWEMDERAAMSWRVRFKRKLGYQYGFPLYWPRDLDLGGKLIEIEFGYERSNGTIVTGTPRRFRVPLASAYQTSPSSAAGTPRRPSELKAAPAEPTSQGAEVPGDQGTRP